MTIEWKRYIDASDLSETSKRLYASQLNCFMKDLDKPIEWIISHPKECIAFLEEQGLSDASRRNRVASVCSLLKHWSEASKEFETERDIWSNEQTVLNQRCIERTLTGQPTEREVVNWVPWKKVLEKEAVLRQTECGSWHHLLLSMYTHIEPMRGDFGNVRLFVDTPPVDMSEADNYIYLASEPNKSTISLGEYKTSRKYGVFTRFLPDSLVYVIRRSLVDAPRDWLFINMKGEPYAIKNSFVKFANRLLFEMFQKHFTISLLRHSFISAIDFNKTNAGDLRDVSRNMHHSMEMQQYYRRDVPEQTVSLVGGDGEDEAARLRRKEEKRRLKKEKKKKKKKKKTNKMMEEAPLEPRIITL